MKAANAYATTLGLLLLVEGIWGLFSPVVFGVLSTNLMHAVIHLGLGCWGIWAARAGRTRGYLLFVGGLLLAVGLLWFVPSVGEIIVRLLNVNRPVACVNVVVGIVSLLMANGARSASVVPS